MVFSWLTQISEPRTLSLPCPWREASAARAAASSASTRSPSGTLKGSTSNGELHLPTAFAVGASVDLAADELRLALAMATASRAQATTASRSVCQVAGEAPRAVDDGAHADAPALLSRRRGRCGRPRSAATAWRTRSKRTSAHEAPAALRRVEPDGDERLRRHPAAAAARPSAAARARATAATVATTAPAPPTTNPLRVSMPAS